MNGYQYVMCPRCGTSRHVVDGHQTTQPVDPTVLMFACVARPHLVLATMCLDCQVVTNPNKKPVPFDATQ